MDKLVSQLETVCLVSILGGILNAVIPKGRLKGAFSSFCAVVIILALFLPLGEIKSQGADIFNFKSEKFNSSLESEVKTAETLLFESLLEKSLTDALGEMGYKLSIKTECENRNGEPEVKKITVKGEFDAESKSEIEEYLKKSFSGSEISFEEDENE